MEFLMTTKDDYNPGRDLLATVKGYTQPMQDQPDQVVKVLQLMTDDHNPQDLKRECAKLTLEEVKGMTKNQKIAMMTYLAINELSGEYEIRNN
jgi:hypothetical protein